MLAGIMVTGAAATAQDFASAEKNLVACAGQVDWHPPYGVAQAALMNSCDSQLNAYAKACVSLGRYSEFDCRLAGARLAFSIPKVDPIDRKFSDCLIQQSHSVLSVPSILSLCREARTAFAVSCQRRKASAQCDKDIATLAQSAARAACLEKLRNVDQCN
jgi:hypothetical protein